MTEHPTPITDEDLSAHLDGEGAPDLTARIAADPAAEDRLAELSAAASLVANEPVAPLAPSVVDAMVARAVGAMPESPATTEPDMPATSIDPERSIIPTVEGAANGAVFDGPTPMTAHRSRRLPPTWLVAAALVLVVALGIGLVVTGRDRNRNEQVATSPTTTTVVGGGGGDASTAAGRSPEASDKSTTNSLLPGHGGAPTAEAGPTTLGSGSSSSEAFGAVPLIDLGTFPSPDALRTALAARFPTQAGPTSASDVPSTRAVQRCGTQLTVTLDLKSDPTHLGYGTVDSRSVLVYEFPATSYLDQTPTTLVAAVGAEACDPVVTFQR